jgi:hypothetical protein
MKSKRYAVAAFAANLVLFASTSDAELIDNGITTADTVTGLEWLDVAETVNVSPRDIIVDGYGGLAADGWVHATVEQIATLLENAGITPPFDGTLSPANFMAASQFIDLLGATGGPDNSRFIQAFSATLAVPGGPPFIRHTPTVLVGDDLGIGGATLPGPGVPSTVRNATIGNFLVRPAHPLTLEVMIDVKPGCLPNAINLKSRGVIPVAILSDGDFDAPSMVDPRTILFGPAGAPMEHVRPHAEDVDDDGDLDLVFHFRTEDTGIVSGETEVFLTGETGEGVPLAGSDTILTVGGRR